MGGHVRHCVGKPFEQLSIIKPIYIVQKPSINMCLLLCPIKQESANKGLKNHLARATKHFHFRFPATA